MKLNTAIFRKIVYYKVRKTRFPNLIFNGFQNTEGLKRTEQIGQIGKVKLSCTETELNFWMMMLCIDILGVSVSKEEDYLWRNRARIFQKFPSIFAPDPVT